MRLSIGFGRLWSAGGRAMSDLRHEPRPDRRPLYWPIVALIRLVVRIFTRTHVHGRDRIPAVGGLLVVANHVSDADPFVLVSVFPRPLTFMTKVELFRHWHARALARWTQAAFPVRRGQVDIGAVKDALSYLRRGAAVVVFPEGTRQREGLGAAHPGVAYLATRSKCPVLPVGIIGTEGAISFGGLLRRPIVDVRIGHPFTVESSMPVDGQADEIMARVAELLPEERRGVYRPLAGAARSE